MSSHGFAFCTVAEWLHVQQAANGFCIMASAGNEQRAVRGTAVCVQAARFNHGAPACTPWLNRPRRPHTTRCS